ncbi:hypothetical protein AJ80_03890 [Polytolypa hystricis UAMH7299]|uniref:ASTRA-associated protein 1 n=1 Tax=Polytolypa hystricis (strain UAMH7299) TaxID=1447883 RepID=A0A2B7Y5W7_POLH7|nr:hypothetical protein AJ80_03890 [Polytolypa hystricis UAMH7299]
MDTTSPSASTGISQQPGKLPPATPVYVLRGHASPIHALHFCGQNSRLISGDADGWIVVWDTATKRPVAAWRAHKGAVLDVQGVDFELEAGSGTDGQVRERRIFTHGRDHKLFVWRLNPSEEDTLSKELPVDEIQDSQRNEPWLLHSLMVNALNFCAFALCRLTRATQRPGTQAEVPQTENASDGQQHIGHSQVLLGVPNALNSGGIDIFHLPSERRLCTISPDPSVNTGMVMALEILLLPTSGALYIVSGYEDGSVMSHILRGTVELQNHSEHKPSLSGTWERIYANRPHSQPVLSLAVSPTQMDYFLSSSADAIIAKHPILVAPSSTPAAGKSTIPKADSMPLKIVNTKHAGQQGIKIRSDGKIFATAGWDQRVRVYSCKAMRELAVLKWHQEGCYTVAFAEMGVFTDGSSNNMDSNATTTGEKSERVQDVVDTDAQETTTSTSLTRREGIGSLAAIKEQRSRKAQLTHWLAAGSKDGKISLWDIY